MTTTTSSGNNVIQTQIIKEPPLWLICFSVLLPASFTMLASSATNVAIPHIAGSFGSTIDETNWAITAYMIANAILIPMTGWLENFFGRKKFLRIFIWIFTIGSFICAVSHSLNMLVVGRLIQGIGGGPLMPITQAILISSFPHNKRGHAMALFALAITVFSLLGPTMGGILVDFASWHWIYLINIPIGIISVILIKFNISEIKQPLVSGKVDYIGFIFLVIWLLSMQIVLDKGQQYGWFDCSWICWLSGISLLSFIIFIFWELDYKFPMVNLKVFKDRNFLWATTIGTVLNTIIFATIVLIPMFLQNLMGYDATLAGYSLLPRALASAVTILVIGTLVEHIDNRILIISGFILLGISTYMCTGLNLTTSFESLIIPNVIMGVGIIFVFTPISAFTLSTLPKNELANGAGIHSLCKAVSTAFVTSIAASMVTRLSQVHQTYLVHNLSNYNLVFQNKINNVSKSFGYLSCNLAHQKAELLQYKQLLIQAKLMAFSDLFAFFALLAFILIPLTFFLKVKD